MNKKEGNPIQVAGRLFAAMEYLASYGQTSLSQLASALKLSKSTVHRLLESLQYMGYVRQDVETGRYELTYKLVDLAGQVQSSADLAAQVRPYLRELMNKSGETVHFVQLEGTDVVYIDKVESERNSVRMMSRIGTRLPFYRTGVGKAIAAGMTDRQVKELWEQCTIERATPYTITNLDDFMEAIEEVRRKGYALDNEENETGLRCVAAALRTGAKAGHPQYAFSISVPIARMDNDRIRELSQLVLETQRGIDSCLVS